MSTILAIDLGKFNNILCWYDYRVPSFAGTPSDDAVVLHGSALVRSSTTKPGHPCNRRVRLGRPIQSREV
ncbi:MAG: hypothetical protein JNJ77_14280 [Planctomycetia bacterium]|nr:hypothetical protein [Planctomycetia bacterium]